MSVFDRVPFPFRLNLRKSEPPEPSFSVKDVRGPREMPTSTTSLGSLTLGPFRPKAYVEPSPVVGAERTHADQYGNFVPADHPDARPVAGGSGSLSERALQGQRREASLDVPPPVRPPQAAVSSPQSGPALRDLGEIHDHIITAGGDVSSHEGVGISQQDKDRWTAQFNMHAGKKDSNGRPVHTEDEIYDMGPEDFSGVRSLASIHDDYLSGQGKNITPEEKARWVAQRKIIHDDLYPDASPTSASLRAVHSMNADEFGKFTPSPPDPDPDDDDDDDGVDDGVDDDDGVDPVDPDRPPVDPDRPPVGDDDGVDDDDGVVDDDDGVVDDDDGVVDDDDGVDPHDDFRSALLEDSPYRFDEHLYPEFEQVPNSLSVGSLRNKDQATLEQQIQSNKKDIVKTISDDVQNDGQNQEYGLDPEDVQDIDSLAQIAPSSFDAWRSTVSSVGAITNGDYSHLDDEQAQAMKDTYPGVYFSDLSHQDVNYRWPAASSMEGDHLSAMGKLCAMGIADKFFGTRTARKMSEDDDEKLHQMQEILQGDDEDAIASVNMDEFFILLNSHAIEHKINALHTGLADANGDAGHQEGFMNPAYLDPAYYETAHDLGYEYSNYDDEGGLTYDKGKHGSVFYEHNYGTDNTGVFSGVTPLIDIKPRHQHIHNIIRHDAAVDDTPATTPGQQAVKSQQNRELISLNRQAIDGELLTNPQRYADSFGNVFGKDEIAVLAGLIDKDEKAFREGGSRNPETSESEVASRAKALMTTGFATPDMNLQELNASGGFDHFAPESEQLKRDYPGIYYGPKIGEGITHAEDGADIRTKTTRAALANHRWPPASKMTDKEQLVFMRLCAMGLADQYLGTRTTRIMQEEDEDRLVVLAKKVQEGRPANMDEFFILLNSHARTHRIDAAKHGLFNAALLNNELALNGEKRGYLAPRGAYEDPGPFKKIPEDMNPDEEDVSDDSTGWRSLPPKPHRKYHATPEGKLYRTKEAVLHHDGDSYRPPEPRERNGL